MNTILRHLGRDAFHRVPLMSLRAFAKSLAAIHQSFRSLRKLSSSSSATLFRAFRVFRGCCLPLPVAAIRRCAVCSLLAFAAPLSAAVLKIELPPETEPFKPGPGSEIANAQCLVCHSVEYVSTQPSLGRSFWVAEVEKMRAKYGAPIGPEQLEPLVNYLLATYNSATNAAPPAMPAAIAKPVSPSASVQATTGEAVAAKYGCLTCHNVDTKIVGPSYKDIAAKYRQHPDATAKVAEQIHKGGSGKWGSVIMPPFPTVTDKETQLLADWILSRK